MGEEEDTRGFKEDTRDFKVSPEIAAAVALLVAALAAVGVSGALLARAVRNSPGLMALVVSVAILVPAVALVGSAWRAQRHGLAILTGVLALAGIYAVLFGAASLALSETPSVSASAELTENGYLVTVDAKAAGLRADQDMLVQLQGLATFPEDGSMSELEPACVDSRLTTDPAKLPPSAGLLAWQQAGPDSGGDATVSFKVTIPQGQFEGMCAAAIYLAERPPVLDWVKALPGLPEDLPIHASLAVVRLT